MSAIISYLTANKAALIAALGALYTLLSVINGLVKSPKAKSFIGLVLDGISFISRADAEGSVKVPFRLSVAPGELQQPPGASARAFLPLVFLAAGMTLSSCGILKPLPEPTPAQYDAALKSCLEAAGASQGLAVGEQLLACFEQPSETVAQYEQCAEQDSGALAIDVLSVVAQCAVDSWLDFNPVPANTAPKPAVLAAREVRVHFLHAMVGR